MFTSRSFYFTLIFWAALFRSSQATFSDVAGQSMKEDVALSTVDGTRTSDAISRSKIQNEVGQFSDNDEFVTADRHFETTIAGQLHKVLVKEFDENETVKGVVSEGAGRSFDSAVRSGGGTLETVARVTRGHEISSELEREKDKDYAADVTLGIERGSLSKPANQRTNYPGAESHEPDSIIHQIRDVSRGIDRAMRSGKGELEDVERLIDSSDNEFVISNPKRGTMELQQDVQLISDIVVLFCSAAIGSTVSCFLGQPLITGYLLAGSIVGPGGLGLIVELVQVETLAQFGVIFLLFGLGLEFSPSKLRQVRGVAVLGGVIQILLMMMLCGVASDVTGAGIKEGVFVGALLSMSSTAIAGKCILETGALDTLQGQITIGTLILQDCCIGLLFALIPVLAGSNDLRHGSFILLGISFKMAVFLGCCLLLSRSLVVQVFRFASQQDAELFQTITVAFCLMVAVCSDTLGLSFEFGAFAAGVMISVSPYAEKTMQNLEQIRNIFAALFMVSIGLIMNPFFLWIHFDVLLVSLLIVVTLKTGLIGIVVRSFGYSSLVSTAVGLSLAQVGEFSFVLLSRASNIGLIERKLYLLLLGTTALSLVATPLLVRWTPQLLRLGCRWKVFKSGQEDYCV